MEEMILNVKTLPEPLFSRFRSTKVRMRVKGGVVTLTPIREPRKATKAALKKQQQSLLEEIKAIRGIIRSDIDEKLELAKARDEKYARIG